MACRKTTEVPGRAEAPKRSGPKPAGIAHRTRPPMNAEAADDYECMLIGLESAWASPEAGGAAKWVPGQILSRWYCI
jgi:hypothetical protein